MRPLVWHRKSASSWCPVSALGGTDGWEGAPTMITVERGAGAVPVPHPNREEAPVPPSRKEGESMRRFPIVLSVLAVVLLGVVVAAPGGPTTAQEATTTNFAGSWQVVIALADGRTVVALSTYGADGTVVSSGLPAQPTPPGAPPGVVFLSPGHGTWEATSPDSANVTYVHLRASAEGQPLGTLTARLAVTLGADGDAFSGELVSTLADPAGNALASFTGTVQATRIVAEAPELPAGTPAA
jgi:hypothetical protein